MMPVLSRREVLLSLLSVQWAQAAIPGRVFSFSVLGLLKPARLIVRSIAPSRLHCASAAGSSIAEAYASIPIEPAASPFFATGPAASPVAFELEIPNILRRRYFGTLSVQTAAGILVPVVTMSLSTAVRSIVAAELPTDRAPLPALMAQAVVARSFLLGTSAPRHPQADFCDTTHCQFLRSPAPEGSRVSQSVGATSGMLLTKGAAHFPASYSAACGGRTEGGERDGFLYTAVDCPTCRRQRFTRRGHGWGLCQEGAMDLARQGRSCREILAHYFPGASLRYL